LFALGPSSQNGRVEIAERLLNLAKQSVIEYRDPGYAAFFQVIIYMVRRLYWFRKTQKKAFATSMAELSLTGKRTELARSAKIILFIIIGSTMRFFVLHVTNGMMVLAMILHVIIAPIVPSSHYWSLNAIENNNNPSRL